MSSADGPRGPARRAVLRWAWRLFRAEWRQQLLALTLVTVAVAAAVAVATMAVNAEPSSEGEFGDATAMARIAATTPEGSAAAVAAARSRFGEVEVIGHAVVAVPGSIEPLEVRAQAPDGHFSRPTLALRHGAYPDGPDEVALTDAVAELLSAGIGDQVTLGGTDRRVVGLVENPSDLSDDFALVAPDEAAAVDSLTLLFDEGDRLFDEGDRQGVNVELSTPGRPVDFVIIGRPDQGPVAALVLVATTVAMALVGLVAASGFVVVAQRRQRQLGLLAAIGATQRHLRLVVLANGAIVGAVAAATGTALGVIGWVAASPAVEQAANHRIDRFDVPWGLVAECALLAVAMTTAAAWWPARTLARLPVMAALSGRPSPPSPIHRSSAVALVLLACGMGAIAASHPTAESVRPLLLIAGVVAVVGGAVFAAPAAIRVLGAPARWLPFAPRLALRDLVRYQARAAAALAAITLGLGISVAVVGIAKANEYDVAEGNLSDHQLVIRVGGPKTAPDPELSDAAKALLDTNAATVADTLGAPTLLTLDVAMNTTPSSDPRRAIDPSQREPVSQVFAVDANSFRFTGFPYVATPQLLDHLGIDPATIDADTDLLTARTDDVFLADMTKKPDTAETAHVQHLDLPAYTSGPNALITEGALGRHGWVPARAGWLVEAAQPLRGDQIAAARSAAAALGLTIETRSSQDGLATLRSVATAVGALLALAIVAMTVGLLRGESTRDLRTLTATGATSFTRRALTATTAGALAVLGVVLGTAGAYAALVAGYRSELDKLTPLPVAHLLLLAIGLPLVATTAGWLLAGREPRSFARQALD